MQENAIQNFIWEMAAILSRPQCVKDCAVYISQELLMNINRNTCLEITLLKLPSSL